MWVGRTWGCPSSRKIFHQKHFKQTWLNPTPITPILSNFMLVILSYSSLPAQVHSFGPWRLLHSKTKAPGTRCTTSPQKATRWEVKPWQVYDIRMRVWPYNDHLGCTNFANSAIPKVFRVSCADFARSGSALFRSKPLINKTSTKLGATCSVGIQHIREQLTGSMH